MAIDKHSIKFEIDQLRKDKMIYALESIATSLVSIVIYIIIENYLEVPTSLVIFASTLVVGYWIYCMFGNLLRLKKITELEDKLK